MAKRIGDMLCDEGIVTSEMIRYALRVQKASGKLLGDTLLALKFVTDQEIARVLAKQAGLGFEPLEGFTPAKEALREIPYQVAQRSDFLPLEIEIGELIIAIADPFAMQLNAKLARYTTKPVKMVVAPKARLRKAIETFYYLQENPISEEIETISKAAQKGQHFKAERLVELIIRTAIDTQSSDIHVASAGFATLVSYRIDGVLQLFYSLSSVVHSRIISVVKVDAGMDVAEQNRPQDGRLQFSLMHDKYDLRISTVPAVGGESLVMRVLANDSQLKSLEELGYNTNQLESVNKMVASPYGLILVVGPTGSGKSTSLYAMLRKINMMQKNVMTIEDPVEYQMPLVRQVAVNEKAGITFGSAIRGFLRQDPDVILIGEVRDEETSQLAIRAAQTGHLVLSTVHANDATSAVARLRDLGITNFILASSLTGVVAQRLVRRLCGHCKIPAKELSDEDRVNYKLSHQDIYQHQGCEHCNNTGYHGRIAVGEILELDDSIRELIDSGASPLEIRRLAVRNGMYTLFDSGLELLYQGNIDLEEFKRVIRVEDEPESRDQKTNAGVKASEVNPELQLSTEPVRQTGSDQSTFVQTLASHSRLVSPAQDESGAPESDDAQSDLQDIKGRAVG